MIPLKMATTMKPRKRLYQPSMIVGRKGTKTSSPSVPKTRRTATNVNGDISATATLTNRHGKSRLRSRDGMKVPLPAGRNSCIFVLVVLDCIYSVVALVGTVQARWPAPSTNADRRLEKPRYFASCVGARPKAMTCSTNVSTNCPRKGRTRDKEPCPIERDGA